MISINLSIPCTKRIRTALFGIAILSLVSLSRADVIVSNLSQSPSGTDASAHYPNDAQSFTTPGGSNLMLQDVEVVLFGNGGTVLFSLYGNCPGGYPGCASSPGNLGTVTPAAGSGYETYKFTASYTLAPSTTYWLITSNLDPVPLPNWAYTSSASYSGTGTLGKTDYSDNGGAVWTSSTHGPFLMQVDATSAAPEPATFLLSLLPLAGIGMLKRAAKRRT